MKLMSMLKFVKEQNKIPKSQAEQSRSFYDCCNFAKFLELFPQIWMFVPCKLVDGVWVVLEESKNKPQAYDSSGNKIDYAIEKGDYVLGGDEQFEEYRQAKERCLFDGFFVIDEGDILPRDVKSIRNSAVHIFWYNTVKGWYLSHGIRTIEDLTIYDLELTETGEKQIN